MRFGSWRSVVAPTVRENGGNIGAQPQSHACTTAPKIFWKIYFHYDFGAQYFVRPKPFLNFLYKIWQQFKLSALYSDERKKSYRCTSTFLVLNYGTGIEIKGGCTVGWNVDLVYCEVWTELELLYHGLDGSVHCSFDLYCVLECWPCVLRTGLEVLYRWPARLQK